MLCRAEKRKRLQVKRKPRRKAQREKQPSEEKLVKNQQKEQLEGRRENLVRNNWPRNDRVGGAHDPSRSI